MACRWRPWPAVMYGSRQGIGGRFTAAILPYSEKSNALDRASCPFLRLPLYLANRTVHSSPSAIENTCARPWRIVPRERRSRPSGVANAPPRCRKSPGGGPPSSTNRVPASKLGVASCWTVAPRRGCALIDRCEQLFRAPRALLSWERLQSHQQAGDRIVFAVEVGKRNAEDIRD